MASRSVVHADEAAHWDALHVQCPIGSIILRPTTSTVLHEPTESILACLRRMVDGQNHRASPQYLHQYASHAAWMEIIAVSTTAR